jgi:hypothetical protein
MVPVVKRIASTSEVFPAPALETTATFLSDSARSSFMGSSFVKPEGKGFFRLLHRWITSTPLLLYLSACGRTCEPPVIGKTDIAAVTHNEVI